MNCPKDRGGCGRRLMPHEGAFCDACIEKAHYVERVRDAFIDDLIDERAKQDGKWGPAHDARHTSAEWRDLVLEYNSRAYLAENTVDRRENLVKIAALAMAAAEAAEKEREGV